jgi:hypothetical protein
MIRTLFGTIAALAIAGAAQAASVTVDLAGKDGGAIRSALKTAAAKACSGDYARDDLRAYSNCVVDSYGRALADAQGLDPAAFRTDTAAIASR